MSRLNTRRADQAISAGGGDARKTLKGLIATNDFLRPRFDELRAAVVTLAVGFRRSASSRMPCEEGPAVLTLCSSKLAHT
jgi:hypothetical protein